MPRHKLVSVGAGHARDLCHFGATLIAGMARSYRPEGTIFRNPKSEIRNPTVQT
jgi:hypothetical protein